MGETQRTIFIGFLCTVLFLTSISALFVYLIARQIKNNILLQKEKLLTEINAIENERNYISSELHDDLAPLLVSIKMRMHLINTSELEKIEECSKALTDGIDKIRLISKRVSPLITYNIGFQEAIEQYITQYQLKKTISIEVIEKNNISVSAEKNVHIYRILQEIIHNTIKHAQAKKLTIEFDCSEKELLIRTSDDGIGFNYELIKKTNRLGQGLISIQNRVSLLGGTFTANKYSKKGTQYNIRIPV